MQSWPTERLAFANLSEGASFCNGGWSAARYHRLLGVRLLPIRWGALFAAVYRDLRSLSCPGHHPSQPSFAASFANSFANLVAKSCEGEGGLLVAAAPSHRRWRCAGGHLAARRLPFSAEAAALLPLHVCAQDVRTQLRICREAVSRRDVGWAGCDFQTGRARARATALSSLRMRPREMRTVVLDAKLEACLRRGAEASGLSS